MALIALEGLDRSGKTTQATLLVERLQYMNIPVVRYRFPKRVETSSGEKIRQFLNREITLDTLEAYELFLEQRAEAQEEIKNHIKNGTIVIIDRYCGSGIAYGTAYGLDINCCKAMESKILKPDLTIFFNAPVGVAMLRAAFGLEKFETVKYQRDALLAYHQIRESSWITVDATKSKQNITDEVCRNVLNFLSKKGVRLYPLPSDYVGGTISNCPAQTI